MIYDLCETNPIPLLRISGTEPGNRRPPSAELSNCGLKTDLLREAPCALPAQGPNGPPRDEMARNRPNWAGRGRPGAWGMRGVVDKQTQSLPLCRLGDQHSRESKSCETKPNLGALGVSGERCRGPCTNKPNLAGRPLRPAALGRADRWYKQTQFRRVATGLTVQTNPIYPCRMGRRGRGWILLRQTNPIARSGAPRGVRLRRGGVATGARDERAIVPNKANLGRAGVFGGRIRHPMPATPPGGPAAWRR
jgi:hypothetical protein